MFGKLVANTWTARFVRRHLAPKLVWFLTRFRAPKQLIFRIVSQTRINYRMSVLSEARAGGIDGGDRLPYVAEIDNQAPLNRLNWQLHVYGQPSIGLTAQAKQDGLDVCVFPYTPATSKAHLKRDAAYLVRPDGYVGLAMPTQDPLALSAYISRLGLGFSDARLADAVRSA
jgi:hypothetical protein